MVIAALLARGKGLFGGMGGSLGGGARGSQRPAFLKTLTLSDFNDDGTSSGLGNATKEFTTANNWASFGYAKVPAQQRWRVGYGTQDAPMNQGYMYMLFVSGSVNNETAARTIEGSWRLRVVTSTADELDKTVILEKSFIELNGDPNDKNQMIALPEQVAHPELPEDSRIYLEGKFSVATDHETIGLAACGTIVILPITRR